MKAVILAGGLGTRISEESHLKPKPLIDVGGRPMLWHIMKICSFYGINDFVICLGYKGYKIKEYFSNYFLYNSDVTFDFSQNSMEVHNKKAEPWKVTLVDTGEDSMTGGRLKRVRGYLDDEPFLFTYGDGVADINIHDLVSFHKSHGKLATVSSVLPPGRYGALDCSGSQVNGFREKPRGDGGMINGGFFILNPKAIDYIAHDGTSWELEPLNQLASDGELQAFKHEGFWQAMDTLRDKTHLENLWKSNKAPWKVWES
ncbi:glucose-1-phosphate cytidylyltransferase [Echinimonas agarilytica]|uniref:Glucose-1-phosphate cytidylyltransferase n=1 Tax=Echinimonas agarilytica TaxID=1215918 RepID=A0AA41W519_9GAMM|nr:glucose-1-phosphate cytidylyltransferase [Echinimonas agarilytica]MCM2678948.1 glucose-1-phosphate cytidylyltransferase [Echinimonas agarilytica]